MDNMNGSGQFLRSIEKYQVSIEFGLLAVVGLAEIYLALGMWVSSTTIPWINTISVVILAGGLAVTLFSAVVRRRKYMILFEILIVSMFVFAVVEWTYSRVYGNPSYGTDEIAFDQYAAQLLVQHINPYGLNLDKSLELFQVPTIFHTYTLDGRTVDILSYPAMSFLFYVPLLMIGIYTQAAVYVDTLFWVISILLMYFLLPRPYRAIALVIGSSFVYLSYVVGGVTDSLYLPFLLLSSWKWDRYYKKDSGYASWIGPIAFGIAASVKQNAWFLAPFIAIGIYKEHKSMKPVFRYALISFITFLVPNVPFILNNPSTWFRGVLSPFASANVPSGQGMINFTLIERLGGGDLSLFSYSAAALMFAFILMTWMFYPQFKRVLFILPSIVLFFPTRSFASYLIGLFPVFLVSALTVIQSADDSSQKPWKKLIAVSAFIPFALFITAALSVPSPMQMEITNLRTTGELQTIYSIQLKVENRYRHSIEPHFSLSIPQITSFWQITQGPKTLRPGQVATYEISAPNVQSMPSIDGGFLVDAFTVNPDTISTSRVYRPEKWRAFITPETVDKPVSSSQKINFEVQIFDNVGRRVHQRNVPIYLGQVVYDQDGLYAGESRINDNTEGKSPVMALTNSDGVASFTVAVSQVQSKPIYFQAFIQPNSQFPYGYSQIVSVLFK